MIKSYIKYLLLIFISISNLGCSKKFLFVDRVEIIEFKGKLEIYDTKHRRLNGRYLIYIPTGIDRLIECQLKNGIFDGKLKVFIKNPDFKAENFKSKSWGYIKTEEGIPKQYSILSKTINYKDGIPKGIAKEFYANGNLKVRIEIINDSMSNYKYFDLKNQLIDEKSNSKTLKEFFNLNLPVKENLLD